MIRNEFNNKLIIPKSARAKTMPNFNRSHMTSQSWNSFWNIKNSNSSLKNMSDKIAEQRRKILIFIALSFALLGSYLIYPQILKENASILQYAQLCLFFVLFLWISMGFVTALMGAWVICFNDKHSLSSKNLGEEKLNSRTAVVMTICNEDVTSVFAALNATIDSVAKTANSQAFDFYILSDSNNLEIAHKELQKYEILKNNFNNINIYYRRRIYRVKKKSGNVEDFCRRWGKNYNYMIILDADSVMSGECVEKLAKLMDKNPSVGIIQTVPKTYGHDTMHARVEQFSSRMLGRIFTLGMQFWQLGESHYWGHNAIIRIEPFMKYCSLALIKGQGSLSGAILSHDFVEAALMRRAGYKIYICTDLDGSYEQQPPNMLAELQRDRRWCQGNLQNIQLVTQPNLHLAHRVMLLTGVMSYLSAPLWLAFILLGSVSWIFNNESILNIQSSDLNIKMLWILTGIMLLAPRFMGVIVAVVTKESVNYGGILTLLKSTALECILSILKAPVKMVAHSIFVFGAVSGIKLEWKSPPREAENLKWKEVCSFCWMFSLSATVMMMIETIFAPHSIVWLLPVCIPLILAIPITIITGNVDYGLILKKAGYLLTPEEINIPKVIIETQKNLYLIQKLNAHKNRIESFEEHILLK